MHFVIKININDKELFTSSELISHTTGGLVKAQNLLLTEAKAYISELSGTACANEIKIIDIHSFDQVSEPILDSVLLYRLDIDPCRLHIYQKKSKIIPGRVYGQSIMSEFRKVKIFELVEYIRLSADGNTTPIQIPKMLDMVGHGPANIQVPKPLTLAPMADLLVSLKSSPKFRQRYDESILEENTIKLRPLGKLTFMKIDEQISLPAETIVETAETEIVETEITETVETVETEITETVETEITETVETEITETVETEKNEITKTETTGTKTIEVVELVEQIDETLEAEENYEETIPIPSDSVSLKKWLYQSEPCKESYYEIEEREITAKCGYDSDIINCNKISPEQDNSHWTYNPQWDEMIIEQVANPKWVYNPLCIHNSDYDWYTTTIDRLVDQSESKITKPN
jgi:hypothetical protein